jgi:hypothetical protein
LFERLLTSVDCSGEAGGHPQRRPPTSCLPPGGSRQRLRSQPDVGQPLARGPCGDVQQLLDGGLRCDRTARHGSHRLIHLRDIGSGSLPDQRRELLREAAAG